MEFNSY